MTRFKKPICLLLSWSLVISTTLTPLQASMNAYHTQDDNIAPNVGPRPEVQEDDPKTNDNSEAILSSAHQASDAVIEGIELQEVNSVILEQKQNDLTQEALSSEITNYSDQQNVVPLSSLSSAPSEQEPPHSSDGIPYSYQQAFLNKFGWKEQDLLEAGVSLATLDQLLSTEMSTWNFFRWATIENFLGKTFTYPVLDFGGMGHTQKTLQQHPGKSFNSRVWLYGSSIPLQSKWTLQKVLSSRAFIEGVEVAALKGLDLVFAFLLGYQIVQPQTKVLDVLRHGSTNSVLGLANQFREHPQLLSVFTVPIVWGILKGMQALTKVDKVDLEKTPDLVKTLKTTPQSKVTDQLKWLLPLHSGKQALGSLEHWLQWEGRDSKTSPQIKEETFKAIEVTAQAAGSIPSTVALSTLYNLAYSHNLRDLHNLKGIYEDKDLLHLASLKLKAFEALKDLPTSSPLPKLAQAYYLWSLGQSPSLPKVTVPMTTFRAGRVAMQTFSLVAIIKTILEYLNCPDKPGLSFTGYQDWSSDYTQECFDELVRQFNSFPGQPASTLVDVLDQYHFPDGTYFLDLSGKGIKADVIADILRGFQDKGPTLTGVDLSGNNILTPQTVTEVLENLSTDLQIFKMSYLFPGSAPPLGWEEALALRLQYLPQLTSLDLSDNRIGFRDYTGTGSIGQGLQRLPQLTNLNLANNLIGIAIGQALQYLTQLTALDLSNNNIGSARDSAMLIVIGQSLQHLLHLKTLDLSNNFIGLAPLGTVAIGQGLQYVPLLTNLNLAGNFIDGRDSRGPVAIGQGLQKLTQLTTLDLSNNQIGIRDSNGTVAIGQGLQYLPQLTSLDLSNNAIGLTDSNGTVALGQALPLLTRLLNLNLGYNLIGFTDISGIKELSVGLSALQILNTFQFLPQGYSNGTSLAFIIQNLNKALPEQLHLPLLLIDKASIDDFFSSQPKTITSLRLPNQLHTLNYDTAAYFMTQLIPYSSLTTLDLSYNYIGAKDDNGITAVGEGLQRLPQLTNLDLSYNNIGYKGSNGTLAIGQALPFLTRLTNLDLSQNAIGSTDSKGIIAIGQAFQYLSSLKKLDLSYNQIGAADSNGATAVGQGLKYLSQLTSLDFSNNYIDYRGSNGTLAIGQGLPFLTRLTALNLSNNQIGVRDSNGTVAIGQGLQYLSSLKKLDLSYNQIGAADSNGATAVGQGLKYLSQLTNLDLSNNNIGVRDSNGTVAIGQGLQYLSSLKKLDLSYNQIGATDELGEAEIGKSLPYLQSLQSLNISNNQVGSTGPNSSLAILASLPQLSNLQTVVLTGITNISWTEAANALSTINNRKLQDVCQSQLCHGSSITPVKPDSQTSAASSLQAPWIFGLMHRTVQGIKGFVVGSYDALLGTIGSNLREVTTNSPAYFPNIKSTIFYDWQPVKGTLKTYGSEGSYTTNITPFLFSLPHIPSYQAIGK